ncbi:BZ3500_MvSof-1268-A1-R1_Chr6-3g08772 [Microbotryum saponariae]|uniref:BZ3500_MvSof-1268-A1-R1_Chr6-3g08772 protein n=1 Tax=Microbotryum saponariae TaxID=289078 RepID=A0A2X0M5Q2_9BASI|nr:BZ3500_MvSof-1268-A1-R1_Chr6-3g08772 [Microbotryum saponariae]SDA07373.1 BZ3501_MvSof-1269-A2-R1_Chr6-2g08475 [Microbotryum saponariae]
MPVELLPFPPSYCLVGAYRLIHDPTLNRPIWARSQKTLKRFLFAFVPFILISYPLTRLYVTLILSRSPFAPAAIHDAAFLGVSPAFFTTVTLVLGQINALLEWSLRRELTKSRKEVYEATVRSRAKDSEFWQPYVEEWARPPVERAQRNSQKQAFYLRLASPLMRMFVLRVLLTPLSFIPGLAIVVLSALRCLTLGRSMHEPYFAEKKMTPFQIELWMVERQNEYRMFGFVASLLERLPLIGIVLTISNRIGAAMWSHDLEKRQHAFATGELKPTKVYESKLAQIPVSDLPDDFAGGFPGKRKDEVKLVPPPLPKRSGGAKGKEL